VFQTPDGEFTPVQDKAGENKGSEHINVKVMGQVLPKRAPKQLSFLTPLNKHISEN